MQKHYLTPNHNFNLGYICLTDLRLKGLPPTISVDGDVLLCKTEFHTSLVCTKRLAPLIDPDHVRDVEVRLAHEFQVFAQATPLTDFSLTNNFYIVTKGDRKTVVVLCDVPGLKELFEHLSRVFGVALPVQPAHITIYTLQPDAGIGILSEDELQNIGRPLKLPELVNIKKA